MPELTTRALHPNDLFSLKYVHDARLSPDGRRIVYVTSRTVEETGEELFDIAIEELATGARHELHFPGRATFPRWSPDGTRLAFIGMKADCSRLYIADIDLQNSSALTPEGCRVVGPCSWSPDGSTIAYTVSMQRNSDGVLRIHKRIFRSEGLGIVDDLTLGIHLVHIQSRSIRRLNVGRTVTMQPLFSPCGRLLLFLGSDSAVGRAIYGGLKVFTVDILDEQVVEIVGDRWFIAAVAWSPCGQRVVIAGAFDSPMIVPTVGLWVVSRDGSNPQCRTAGFIGNVGLRLHHDMPTWDTSQNNLFVVADTDHVYATVTTRGCAEIWRIALDGAPQCEPVVAGSRTCVVMDVNAQTTQVLFGVSDLHTPWDLYLKDGKSGEEKRLTRLNDAVLRQWPTLRYEHLRFESADGLPLEAWYLVRADRQGARPTVMFIHGGPMLATGHVFRFDLHLLASNGYSVLFANFRGSEGYGESFVKAIQGDWGGRGFNDHMATVDAAVARGLSDPDRLGVWGPSHGGFATAWIVGHTTRFRAAVVESGSTNWATKYYLSDAPDWIVKELGGRPDEIPDVYRSRSPLTYAKNCRTPTLMLHGEEDARCPLAEAEQFYRALHDTGCPTELVRIPGMKHMGDSTGPLRARLTQNEALLEWFERHL